MIFLIYLDQSATSYPKPEEIYHQGLEYAKHFCANPGRSSYPLAYQTHHFVEETREATARFFGLNNAKALLWTTNATEALNIALKGLTEPGDLLYISPLEHHAVTRPLSALREKKGVRYEVLPHNEQGLILLEACCQKIQEKKPKALVINHCSNVNGTLQPLGELSRLAREQEIPFIVDAAQSAGSFPYDLKENPVTALCVSAHKGLYGPTGLGFLLLGDETPLQTLKEGGTGSFSEQFEQPQELPQRHEAGTLNLLGIAFWRATLDFWERQGASSLRSLKMQRSHALFEGLRSLSGISFWGDPDQGVFSLRIPGLAVVDLAEILQQHFQIASRSGLHCAPLAHQTLKTFPEGTLRLSIGFSNSSQDILQSIQALQEITQEFCTR